MKHLINSLKDMVKIYEIFKEIEKLETQPVENEEVNENET